MPAVSQLIRCIISTWYIFYLYSPVSVIILPTPFFLHNFITSTCTIFEKNCWKLRKFFGEIEPTSVLDETSEVFYAVSDACVITKLSILSNAKIKLIYVKLDYNSQHSIINYTILRAFFVSSLFFPVRHFARCIVE